MAAYTAQAAPIPKDVSRDAVFLDPTEATLVTAVASYHTNDDDKDWDTDLTITIEKGHDQFAKSDRIRGTFPDHHDNGPFSLFVQGTVRKSQLQGATTTLRIDANGNDTWRFNYFLELAYSDGSRQRWEWYGNELKENRNIKTFPM